MSDSLREILADDVREFIETTEGMSFIPDTARNMFEAGDYEDLKTFMGGVMTSYPEMFGFEGFEREFPDVA